MPPAGSRLYNRDTTNACNSGHTLRSNSKRHFVSERSGKRDKTSKYIDKLIERERLRGFVRHVWLRLKSQRPLSIAGVALASQLRLRSRAVRVSRSQHQIHVNTLSGQARIQLRTVPLHLNLLKVYPFSCRHHFLARHALYQPAASFRRHPVFEPRHPSRQVRHHPVFQRRNKSFLNSFSAHQPVLSAHPRLLSLLTRHLYHHQRYLDQDPKSTNHHTRSQTW